MTAAEPRTLLSAPDRRESLLRAAARAFAGAGYAATSMDDVAAEDGVTKLIVYRHFDSKEELYRAVLERVSARVAEEFLRGMNRSDRRGFAVRSFLTVAREDPAGFRLMFVHASREPQFAVYAADFRAKAVAAADLLIGDTIADRVIHHWAASTLVSMLVEATLAWLDHGSEARDDEFVDMATAGVLAMYQSWT